MAEFKLENDKIVIVDRDDLPFLTSYRWQINSEGYVVSWRWCPLTKKTTVLWLHRLVNKTPSTLICDHLNHNKLDNRKTNLRNCSNSQNLANQIKRPGLSSKYKGVVWHRRRQKWMANIHISNSKNTKKTVYLGYFDNETKAALVYDKAAKICFGSYALTNFP